MMTPWIVFLSIMLLLFELTCTPCICLLHIGPFRCNIKHTPIGAETGHVHISFSPNATYSPFIVYTKLYYSGSEHE